jgi:hypothetical protein
VHRAVRLGKRAPSSNFDSISLSAIPAPPREKFFEQFPRDVLACFAIVAGTLYAVQFSRKARHVRQDVVTSEMFLAQVAGIDEASAFWETAIGSAGGGPASLLDF